MSDTVAVVHQRLTEQIGGLVGHYCRMLDDEFLFASAVQVPQVATIFDRMRRQALPFAGDTMTLPQLLALIAYRYGFTSIKPMGHGGYALVIGHHDDAVPSPEQDLRRVLRFVPDHHVPDVTGQPDKPRSFDVRLNTADEPIREVAYPLLLSDLFLLPRHTTRLVFQNERGELIQAGGRPAILHCQLLPEVIALNQTGLNQEMARAAGELLEAALATLGVSVADAHGGNGGVLVGPDGQPMIFQRRREDGTQITRYVPVVLDYGYYAEIGPKTLASVLVRNQVTLPMMSSLLDGYARNLEPSLRDTLQGLLRDDSLSVEARFAEIIQKCGLPRQTFGRLMYRVEPPILITQTWIDYSQRHWQTTKERSYPPLYDQSRLTTLYPAYDEILFPQRIEEYRFTLAL